LRREFAEGKCKAGNGIAVKVVLARTAMSETQPDPILAGFRASIDNIDAALIHILAERFRITQAVGAYKAEKGLPPSDPSREERQIARLRKLAEEAHLDPEFSEKFLRFIIDEVIRHHVQAQVAK
jgi:chorismate mutase